MQFKFKRRNCQNTDLFTVRACTSWFAVSRLRGKVDPAVNKTSVNSGERLIQYNNTSENSGERLIQYNNTSVNSGKG